MSVNANHSQRPAPGVTQWRERTLTSAGFDDALAAQLAGERDVDLHALLELVDHGCPPYLAAASSRHLDRVGRDSSGARYGVLSAGIRA